jgi:CBS domain-containing protein
VTGIGVIPFGSGDVPPCVVDIIYRMKIKDVMSRNVITAEPDQSLRVLQELMRKHSISGIPIVTGRRLVGIISVDDIIQALDLGHIEERVDRWMSRAVIVLEEDMPLSFGISFYEKYSYGRFPVLNKNRELVGIISSRDIILALLIELDKELEKREDTIDRKRVAPEGTIHREFRTRRFDFEHAGKASTEIKKLLKKQGIHSKTIRRASVAAYELEMNQVVHSTGGRVILEIDRNSVRIEAEDTGPGIPDVEKALTEGFSTANEWIRSLGFGAGMGLPNTKRVSDEFSIRSGQSGTVVNAIIHIKDETNENSGNSEAS